MSGTAHARPRVLHTAMMSVFEPGIYQQMGWEAEATEAEGLPWDTRIFTSLEHPDPAGIMVPWRPAGGLSRTRVAEWITFRKAYYAWVRGQVPDYDVVLLRHFGYDPFAAGAMRRIDRPVGSVHHTIEVPQLRTQPNPLKGLVLAGAETVLGRRNIEAADFIVAVASQIADYEISRIRTPKRAVVYPNGALLDADVVDRRGDVPELLYVSGTFHPWHGLDVLFESVARSDADFTLHVAGRVDPAVSAGCSDPRVVFHGLLDEDELRVLTTRAWVGVSTLALDRHQMAQSPLKVRGYLAQGVATYGGHPDVFPKTSRVYRRGGADISQMLDYAHQMRPVTREAVRSEAEGYIDKRILVRELYATLATVAEQEAQVR